MLCGWGVKAGILHSTCRCCETMWVAGKTAWSLINTCQLERLRGELIMIKRYTKRHFTLHSTVASKEILTYLPIRSRRWSQLPWRIHRLWCTSRQRSSAHSSCSPSLLASTSAASALSRRLRQQSPAGTRCLQDMELLLLHLFNDLFPGQPG